MMARKPWKLACVADAKRGGGGGREKGKIPLLFFPSSLSPTPYPFRRLLRRLLGNGHDGHLNRLIAQYKTKEVLTT